jgi:hypothetical protein
MKGEIMNKYVWFVMGYFTALCSVLVISCSYTPLEANINDCGSYMNPCYMKVVE